MSGGANSILTSSALAPIALNSVHCWGAPEKKESEAAVGFPPWEFHPKDRFDEDTADDEQHFCYLKSTCIVSVLNS